MKKKIQFLQDYRRGAKLFRTGDVVEMDPNDGAFKCVMRFKQAELVPDETPIFVKQDWVEKYGNKRIIVRDTNGKKITVVVTPSTSELYEAQIAGKEVTIKEVIDAEANPGSVDAAHLPTIAQAKARAEVKQEQDAKAVEPQYDAANREAELTLLSKKDLYELALKLELEGKETGAKRVDRKDILVDKIIAAETREA
jgi:hypothetical protein